LRTHRWSGSRWTARPCACAVSIDGAQTRLLAAATHGEQLVLGQVLVGVKSNEIPQFTPLISGLAAAWVDLSHVVITAGALCLSGR
jgi:hypothetical protein